MVNLSWQIVTTKSLVNLINSTKWRIAFWAKGWCLESMPLSACKAFSICTLYTGLDSTNKLDSTWLDSPHAGEILVFPKTGKPGDIHPTVFCNMTVCFECVSLELGKFPLISWEPECRRERHKNDLSAFSCLSSFSPSTVPPFQGWRCTHSTFISRYQFQDLSASICRYCVPIRLVHPLLETEMCKMCQKRGDWRLNWRNWVHIPFSMSCLGFGQGVLYRC